jgi:hypothetical protein
MKEGGSRQRSKRGVGCQAGTQHAAPLHDRLARDFFTKPSPAPEHHKGILQA